jgi:hypothetical protein
MSISSAAAETSTQKEVGPARHAISVALVGHASFWASFPLSVLSILLPFRYLYFFICVIANFPFFSLFPFSLFLLALYFISISVFLSFFCFSSPSFS